MKEKCKCGKMAVWLYMPGNSDGRSPYYCENCVSRGCSCNWFRIADGEKPNDESKDWKWITRTADEEFGPIKEGEYWVNLDDKGREGPCVEFDYEEEGFDIDETSELDGSNYNEDEYDR